MKLLIKKIWKIIPPFLRLRLVRLWQDSFTVSVAALVLNERGEILLLNHVLRPFSGWGLPGGFVNHRETPENAIGRELREEADIGISDLRLYRVRIVGSHVEILFIAKTSDKPRVNSHEIIELGWYSSETLPEGLGRAQKAIISDVLRC